MTTELPLIPARDVVAHFARWAVQLAPLGTPERLPECLAALRVYVDVESSEWSIDSVRELLTRFTASDPVVRLWSYPLVQQDDPGELPSEENRFIQQQDLVDSVIASLLVEARHAQEVHRTQGPAAEPLLRQGYRVHFRPGGQSEYVDFSALDAATTEQVADIPPAITPSRPPGFKYSYEVEDHLTPNVHVRVVISGRSSDYLLPVGDCLRAAMTVMSFNLLYRGALFPREGITGPYTPDRVREAQEKVRALVRIADAPEYAPPRVTEIDLDACALDMRVLVDNLTERFPTNFTVDSVVSARGCGKEYRGLVDTDVRTQIMTSGEMGSTMSTERLRRALMTLCRQRGWRVRIEEDPLREQSWERKIRLIAGPFECVVRTTNAQVSYAYMVGVAMLQVPVEVSE